MTLFRREIAMFDVDTRDALASWLVFNTPKNFINYLHIWETNPLIERLTEEVDSYINTYGEPIYEMVEIKRGNIRNRYQKDVKDRVLELEFETRFYAVHHKTLSHKQLDKRLYNTIKCYNGIQRIFNSLYDERIEAGDNIWWVDETKF